MPKQLAARHNGSQFVSAEVRLSYVYALEPSSYEDDGDKMYSVMVLMSKEDTDQIAVLHEAIDAATEAGKSKWNGKIPTNLATSIRDGDEDPNYSDQEAFNGHLFFRAKSKNKPGIIGPDKSPITSSEELYSGCYARVDVNFFAYDYKGSRGIACGLNNIQKVRDGESLGGRSKAEDVFDVVGGTSFDNGDDNDDIF